MEPRHICLGKWMEASTATSVSSSLATHLGSHIREQNISSSTDSSAIPGLFARPDTRPWVNNTHPLSNSLIPHVFNLEPVNYLLTRNGTSPHIIQSL